MALLGRSDQPLQAAAAAGQYRSDSRRPDRSPAYLLRAARLLLAEAAVAAAGEVGFTPFFSSDFRLTLGPLALYALTLVFSLLPPLPVAALAGLGIVALHGAVFLGFAGAGYKLAAFSNALHRYGPELVTYVLLGACIELTGLQRRRDRPATVAALLAGCDLGCSLLELALRRDPVSANVLGVIALAAAGRAAVGTGLFAVVEASERERRWARERQEFARRLVYHARLETDVFFLRKSMREVEAITARAHALYWRLRGRRARAEALSIARDIHEVKKDCQRTLASLSRLLAPPDHAPSAFRLDEIVQLVYDHNAAYAQTLGKQIRFVADLRANFTTARYGPWVTVLNNLVTNGVEACQQAGTVTIRSADAGDRLRLDVADTGQGIAPGDQAYLFSPGFSTKVDPGTGALSGGLGLAHVAALVRAMQGEVWLLQTGPGGTTFRIEVPWQSLKDPPEGG